MESTRQKKVSRLLQKELAEILRKRTTILAPGRIITVTTVRVSPDLGLAKIYLSIFPSTNNEQALSSISSSTSPLRLELGKLVRNQLRVVPELYFYLDDSLDYIDNIDSLLKEE
ncbi:MAG: 30S ribosome-binding factor RbfA [Marinilabiliaceae bacterium]|jgi:ribosome-binding factor A|nr:30S ribosome-binding factor RbfA [Marinilabiliaceae bacterium]